MRALICVMCLFFAAMLGCTPQNAPPPPQVDVSGTVNLNGKPMSEGEVHFSAPGQPSQVFKIGKGSYSGQAFVGKNHVMVVLEKEGPRATTDGMEPTKINTVSHPPVEADVKEGGANTFNIEATRTN